MSRIVVAVDPNTTSGEAANDAGIVVCGRGHSDRYGYVLADSTRVRGGPRVWAQGAVDAFHEWKADRIVAEKNQGGEMVELTIHGVDPTVPVTLVTATRGKRTRAEPVAALYEGADGWEEDPTVKQPQVRHVGVFPELEDEMTTWTPEAESPNRMDALVWGLTELKIWQAPAKPMRSSVPQGRIPGVDERARSAF
jgi:phage terminase large subunit-like protein